MKTTRKDQNAICALLFENDLSFEDDMGLDDSLPMDDEPNVMMQIDTTEPVTPMEDESDDDLHHAVKGDLKKLVEFSSRLQDACKPGGGLEPWMIAKIAKASEYVSDVYFQLDDDADFANMGYELADDSQNI